MSSTDTYLTYWFPASVADSIINEMDAGTLDLTDESYDDYAITSIYEGMSYYTIKRTGANGFEANKL